MPSSTSQQLRRRQEGARRGVEDTGNCSEVIVLTEIALRGDGTEIEDTSRFQNAASSKQTRTRIRPDFVRQLASRRRPIADDATIANVQAIDGFGGADGARTRDLRRDRPAF